MYSYGHVLQYFYNAGMKGYGNKPMEPNLCRGLRFHGTQVSLSPGKLCSSLPVVSAFTPVNVNMLYNQNNAGNG